MPGYERLISTGGRVRNSQGRRKDGENEGDRIVPKKEDAFSRLRSPLPRNERDWIG